MATIVDYDYVQEISTLDALHNLTSDVTTGYDPEIPWVNTFKINAETSTYNIPEWSWIAWWSTDVSWSASDYNTVAWTSGSIYLPDGTSLSITSWNTGNMSATTYIYYDRAEEWVYTTTTASSSVGKDKILLCVASPVSWSWKKAEFQAFGTDDQSTFIYASNIAANSITGNEIQANSITASELDVDRLSAISANLGTITAWTISWTTITAWSTSGTAIKLNPNNYRLEFYYWGSLVWYIAGASVDGHWWILIKSDFAGMLWGDVFDLYSARLRLPVWTNLYN